MPTQPVAQTPNQIAASQPTNVFSNPTPYAPTGPNVFNNPTPYASTPLPTVNPTGTANAPAVIGSAPAATVVNNAQTSVNNKVNGGAAISAAKQNLTTSYDAQGNMVQTGGTLPNGTLYTNTIAKGAPGYIPNPAEAQQQQQQKQQQQQNQQQQSLIQALTPNQIAEKTGQAVPKYDNNGNFIGNGNVTPNPTYTNPSSITPPSNIDYTTQDGQATWYNQDPTSFSTWAKDQKISSDNLFQVKVLAGNQELNSLKIEGDNALKQYLAGTFPLTASQQAQVAGLQQMWQGTINAQTSANETYVNASALASARAGGQYNPMGSLAAAQRAIQTGLDRIAQFQGQEAKAVNDLIQSFQDKDYKAVSENIDRQVKITEAITNNLKTVNDAIVKAKNDAQDQQNRMEDKQYEQVTKPIQEISAKMASSLAPDSVKSAVKNAKTVDDAINAAGDYLQTATGPLGDYLQYQRQARQKGLVPMDYVQWTDDQDKKASKLKISEAYSVAYAQAKAKGLAESEIEAAALKSVGLDASDPRAGILKTILASGKFTKEQAKMISAGVLSGDDPLTVVKNRAKELMSTTVSTQLQARENAQANMLSLQDSLEAYYSKGGNTNIFRGNMEKVINKLGEVKDPGLVGLATKIQAGLQVYRNAISGTAYSEQEGRDIASIFPGINKTQGLNDAIVTARIEQFNDDINAAYQSVLGDAYGQLKALQPLTQDQAKEKIADYFSSADAQTRENIMKMFSESGADDVQVYNNLKSRGLIQ